MRQWRLLAALGSGLALGILATALVPRGYAQQFPRPDPGTGVARVAGTVDIGNRPTVDVGNRPTVDAVQMGTWTVRVADTASVRAAPAIPLFLEPGRRYAITWPYPGDNRVVYRLGGERIEGWVEATREGAERPTTLWINPAQALTIEAVQ